MSAQSQVAAPSEQVVRQAIHWMMRLRGSGDVDLQKACEHWRGQEVEHELAWQRVQQLDRELGLAMPGAGLVLDNARAGLRRRQALKLLSGAAVGGAAFWLTRDITPWERLTADLATATGERRGLALADGSQLQLNTDSAVDIRFDSRQRLIELRRGEILVSSAIQPTPMRVRTAHAQVEAQAARFVLRQGKAASRLSVLQGSVTLTPSSGLSKQVIEAGKSFDVTHEIIRQVQRPNMEAGAWVDGLIVTRDMRLADFLAEVGRYRHGRLACAEAIANRRLSGVFRLDDTDKLLALLPRTLPVELHYRTRWWVTVEERV
ncbi:MULTISPECIES: FecR domain-containing protein [unclassified Pseudomonas]|uniref:FecR domain-containing protein n=1 Tax=unclassified Pseudomonas TaxID=196821 RepID=UPI00129EC688|nr:MULTISPECIES: FecR family protein [unclassified Pseudomonas]MDH4651568.1 FecR family protein [Pseudomonas sp. BN606]MRK20622.1 FecR family protein [Pseudomonas sp. JG-B]